MLAVQSMPSGLLACFFGVTTPTTRQSRHAKPGEYFSSFVAIDLDPASWLVRSRALPQADRVSVAWEVSALIALFDVQDADVADFLIRNSHLPPLILETADRLKKLFGPETRQILRLSRDPEEGSEDLFLVAATREPIDSAYDKLARFDRDWFVSIPAQLKANFGVTLE